MHGKSLLFCGIENHNAQNLKTAAATIAKAIKILTYKSGFILGGYEFNT